MPRVGTVVSLYSGSADYRVAQELISILYKVDATLKKNNMALFLTVILLLSKFQ